MSKFLFNIGDKVKCIAKPPGGSYQCKVGTIATIQKMSTSGHILFFKEDICTDTYTQDQCYRADNFEIYKEKNKPVILWKVKEKRR